MDGQIQWDPYATSEPEHGVTSIIMGKCGLAPAYRESRAAAGA
jgi:N-acyl-D-aspartate/D-glutamate deacylase